VEGLETPAAGIGMEMFEGAALENVATLGMGLVLMRVEVYVWVRRKVRQVR
jgi:hypothetical protein